MVIRWEVLAGGPWLAWVVWDQHGEAVEEVTLDTMAVTSIHSRYDGVTRVITNTSVLLVHESIGEVTRWIIAARRGAAHPDMLFDHTPESEECLGE